MVLGSNPPVHFGLGCIVFGEQNNTYHYFSFNDPSYSPFSFFYYCKLNPKMMVLSYPLLGNIDNIIIAATIPILLMMNSLLMMATINT
jgi:hypothetical protein